MDERLVIDKLRQCQDEINKWEQDRVSAIQTAEFRAWKDRVTKWLKAPGAVTADDRKRFDELLFFVLRTRLYGPNSYDQEDQRRYERDLGHSRHIIDSAIESLELAMQQRHPATATNTEAPGGAYTTALICENGHPRDLDYDPAAPQEPYCKECGAKTISACPRCNAAIHGDYRVPGVTDLSGQYAVPNHCHACGFPYPWTQARQEALKDLIRQIPKLPPEETQALILSVPDLGVVTPRTDGAILRMRRALRNAGPDIGPSIRRALIDYGPDVVKIALDLMKPPGAS